MNVLVVDDSKLTRKAVRRILDMIALDVHEVYEAENGMEAMQLMLNRCVDLVLADLNMPGMSGTEMIEKMQVHAQLKSVPVVVISTEASTTRIEELRLNGAHDYLHKPFSAEQLKGVIERTMEVLSDVVAADNLNQAVMETLETMAFCTLMPFQEESIIPETGVLVEIQFQGPWRGVLQLWGGKILGEMLAENIGCLEEIDEQSATDAWQEICNVVCGLLLPSLANDPAAVFDITVPRVVHDATMPTWENFITRSGTQVFDIDGYALAARLTAEAVSKEF